MTQTARLYPQCPTPNCRGNSTVGTYTDYRCRECGYHFDAEAVTDTNVGHKPDPAPAAEWEGEIAFYRDQRGAVRLHVGAGLVNPEWHLLEKRQARYEHGWGLHDMTPETA